MATAKIIINLFDGARRPLDPSLRPLITVRDGFQKEHHRKNFTANSIELEVPFYNSSGDSYAVLANTDGYADAGFHPVKVSPQMPRPVDLILLPENGRPNFAEATWAKLKKNHSTVHGLLARGAGSDAEGKARYEKFMKDAPGSLAAFFNITTAMRDIYLPVGVALGYMVELIWDTALMQQDRFYAYADARLVDQVVLAAQQGKFEPQSLLSITHKGATRSFKHKQFGEANVQFSFHEDDTKDIKLDGVDVKCVKVELDMDYYRDPVAHFIMEGIGNEITKGDTDPRQIYALRWIAGRHADVPEFDPPYFIGV